MLLLSNIFYQLAFARQRNHSQPDPEKGPDVGQNESEATRRAPSDLHERSETGENDQTNAINDDTDDPEEDLTTDHHSDDDDNDACELETKEAQSSSSKQRFTFSRTSTGSLSPSTWWTRLRGWLNPHTSPTDLESYVPHYRYLPILSGVIIPFSILLEIPGLTEDWYIRTEDRKIVDIRPNTTILDTGLGFSIAFAALANVALVLRFMEKKIKRMTFLCILFLTIHDIINIAAVTIFGVEHRFNDGFTYGPAFWMTVCSTSVSTMTNVTLALDFVRTPNFSNSGSGLTRKQRTLVISVMALLTYIAFGSLAQTFLQKLSFVDSLYFTVVSIETIGFGDIVPLSTRSRVFTCIYSIIGILLLALIVGLTRETVLEGIEVGYIQRVRIARQHRRQHGFERRVFRRWTNAIEWRLRRAGKAVWIPDGNKKEEHSRSCGFWPAQRHRHILMRMLRRLLPAVGNKVKNLWYGRGFEHPHGMRLNLEGLKWAQLEAAAMEAGVPLRMLLPPGFHMQDEDQERSGRPNSEPFHDNDDIGESEREKEETRIPLTHARLGRMIAMIGKFALAVDASSFKTLPAQKNKQKERKSSRDHPARIDVDLDQDEHGLKRTMTEKHDTLQASVEREEHKAFYMRLAAVWAVFLLFWMVGSAIFMATERWSFGVALYFCFISFTTIGYGDYTPVTPAGRSIFVFWALLGVGTMTILISILSDRYSSRYKNLLRSGVVTSAVKRYKERARAGVILVSPASPDYTLVPTSGPDPGATYIQASPSSPMSATLPTAFQPPIHIDRALSESHKRVVGHLEALPEKVLNHAKTFGEDVEYLIKSDSVDNEKDKVPNGLKRLMDDVAGVERLSERIKKEILRDVDARHALLAISIGDALRKIMESAEEVVEALKERDRLSELKFPTGSTITATPGSPR